MGAKGDQVKGRAEEAVGRLVGDEDLEAEGKADRLAGEGKEKVEAVIDKAKDVVETVIDKVKDVANRK
jgi:uncharacterized protein YjbJ (UPF0337 family)